MGRGKFWPQTGPWRDVGTDDEWRGWWGSPHEVLDRARGAAGDLDVRIGGSPTMLRDFLAEDLVDSMHVAQVPILLGRGVRLWDGLEGLEERYDIESVTSPTGIAHLNLTRRT